MVLDDLLKPWQREFIKTIESHPFVVAMVSRSQGKTFSVAYYAVKSAISEGRSVAILSTGERAATGLLRECLKITRVVYQFCRATPIAFDFEHNATEIRFSNGATLTALPANPDTVRGVHVSTLIWDEAAFIPNAEELYAATAPMICSPHTKDGKMIFISTPAGQSGLFYEIWSKNNDFFKFRRTVNEVGLNKEQIENIRKTCLDDDIFAAEFLCQFMDTNSVLFSYELLRASTYPEIPTGPTKTVIGVDIGRSKDLSAISIGKVINGKTYIDRVEILKNKEFTEQFKYICSVVDSTKASKIVVDSTGIGAQIGEDIKKKYGGRAEKFIFSNTTKNELFGRMKQALSTQDLLIPNNDTIISDIHKIRRVVSNGGTISYNATSDSNTGHADICCSIALCLRAAQQSNKSIFMPIAF